MSFNFKSMKGIALVLAIIIISACKHNDNKVAYGEKEKPPVITILIDREIKDSVELGISEIAENLEIIRLETSDSIVLGNIYNLVLDDKYIVVATERDYYLFSRQGKYLRRLIETGRGPKEVLFPIFSKTIKDNILYFADSRKSNKYIYSIDLNTGSLNRLLRAQEGFIQRLFPDTDTSLLVITNSYIGTPTPKSTLLEYSVFRQDLYGNLISEIAHGKTNSNIAMPLFYSLINYGGSIIIANPRFDTIFRVEKDNLLPVWTNSYTAHYKAALSVQKIPAAFLIHFSENSILLERYNIDMTGKVTYRRNNQLLLIDRIENKLTLINSLYLINSGLSLEFSGDIKLDHGQFGMVLQPADIIPLLKDMDFKDDFYALLYQDSVINDHEISIGDNPLLLVGKFK